MEAVKTTVVTCPGCGLSRAMDLNRLPDNVHQLVCPKCRRQFDIRSAVSGGEKPYYRLRKRPISVRSSMTDRSTVSPASSGTIPPPVVNTQKSSLPVSEEEVLTFAIDDEPEAQRASGSTPAADSTAAPARLEEAGLVPWEEKGTSVGRYILTVLKIAFSPKNFFRAMKRGRGLKLPQKFAVYTVIIVALAWTVQYAMFAMNIGEQRLTQIAPLLIAPLVLLPLLYSILIFIQAALFYILLKLFKAVDCGYQSIFRLVAYGAAAKLWLIAPQDWMMLPMAWTALLYYIGFREIDGKKPGIAAIIICILMAAMEIYGLDSSWGFLIQMDFLRMW